MNQRYVTIIGALLLSSLLCSRTSAQAEARTVSVLASKDATIFADVDLENDAVLNSANGRGAVLYSGVDASGGIKRALLKFDVWRHVPHEAHITNVRLILTLARVAEGNASARPVDLRTVMESWGEGATRSDNEHGIPADDGDVTWYYRRYQDFDELWSSAGGNYDYPDREHPAASALIEHPAVGQRVVWSSEEMLDDVESWLVDPGQNYGWGLLNDPEHTYEESGDESSQRNYAYLGFGSRDGSRDAQPVLEVTYECSGTDC
jgi:hypothetical protein